MPACFGMKPVETEENVGQLCNFNFQKLCEIEYKDVFVKNESYYVFDEDNSGCKCSKYYEPEQCERNVLVSNKTFPEKLKL